MEEKKIITNEELGKVQSGSKTEPEGQELNQNDARKVVQKLREKSSKKNPSGAKL